MRLPYMLQLPSTAPPRRRRWILFLILCVAWGCRAFAADEQRRIYDLPAGKAEPSLKRFSQHTGIQLVFDSRIVEGVRVNAVRGELTPSQAMNLLLAGTPLRARVDSRSGIVTIERIDGPSDKKKANRASRERVSAQTKSTTPRPDTQTMTKPSRKVLAALGALVAAGAAPAQSVSSARPQAESEQTVVLSPFVVSAETESGYQATETLAGMRLRTNLKDVGAAIDVLTDEFLDDVGAFDMNDALKYVANMQYADFPSASDPTNLAQWYSASYISRGVVGNTVLVDFFPTGAVPIDRYNTDNLTMMRGANAILFGIGSPAGIVGASSKRALLNRNLASVRLGVDQNDSIRTELDISRVLLRNKLAVRVAALYSKRHTDQRPSLERRNGFYGTLTYKPFPGTTIIAKLEHGIRDRIHVQNHIATDAYTPWVLAGKPLVTSRIGFPATGAAYSTAVGSGLQNMSGGSYLTYIEGSTLPIMDWRGMARGALWSNTVPSGSPGSGLMNLSDRGTLDNVSFTAENAIVPLNSNVMGGYNRNDLRYDVKSVILEQKLWRDLDLELAWNEFESDYLFNNLSVGAVSTRIWVDANVFLPDGRRNPYAGMPYVETGNNVGTKKTGELDGFTTKRATLSYNLELDKYKVFRNVGFGDYRFAGLYQDQESTVKFLTTRIVNVTPLPGNPGANSLNQIVNKLNRRYYLQPGDTGYRYLGPDTFEQSAVLGAAPANTGPLRFEERMADSPPRNTINQTKSYVAAIQGSWWAAKNKEYFHLTGLYGWREDSVFSRAQTFTRNSLGEYTIPMIPAFNYGAIEAAGVWATPNEFTARTKSYNLTFRPIAPVRLFYNYSDIFRNPSANFTDVFDQPLRAAFGTTEDFGIKLDLWMGRIFLTATKFETAVIDSTFDNSVTQREPINDIYNAIGRPELILERPFTYRDDTTKGYEFALTANLAKGWNLRLTVGNQKTVVSAAFDDWVPYFAQNRALWQQFASTPLLRPAAGYTTVADAIARADRLLIDARSIIGQQPADQRNYNSSLNTSYRFDSGRLAGFRIGAGYRWASSNIIGYARNNVGNLDTSRPYKGPDQINTDLSLGYSLRFGRQKYTWDVQVNVYNVFNDDDIKARQAVDDGKGNPVITRAFLPEPRMVQLTNSIRF